MTMDDFTILALWLRYILANALSCPGGETGRHSGLKIRRCRKASCRFDSGPGHQRVSASPRGMETGERSRISGLLRDDCEDDCDRAGGTPLVFRPAQPTSNISWRVRG